MSEHVVIASPTETKAECGSKPSEDVGTTKLNQLATFGAAVALASVANVSGAAPLSDGADAIIEANATLSLVEQTHGTHRVCVRGWVPRWRIVRRHRHVGPARVPVRC
jgi:hypothetical protein